MAKSDRRFLRYYIYEFEELVKELGITIGNDGKSLSDEAVELLKEINTDIRSYLDRLNTLTERKKSDGHE